MLIVIIILVVVIIAIIVVIVIIVVVVIIITLYPLNYRMSAQGTYRFYSNARRFYSSMGNPLAGKGYSSVM